MLLDGFGLVYRGYFALPPLTTSRGDLVNGAFGFASIVLRGLQDLQPDYLAVSFDLPGPTFRHEQYAEYKANRSETPTDFKGQVSLVQEVLAALRVPVVELAGYEADDIIATLTRQAREAGMQVLICSGDRDAFQLVGENVTVLYPKRGVSELARMTPEAVSERYAVAPEHYRAIAAMVGETSDNLAGVPGVTRVVDAGSGEVLPGRPGYGHGSLRTMPENTRRSLMMALPRGKANQRGTPALAACKHRWVGSDERGGFPSPESSRHGCPAHEIAR
jgi:5'-3' exonuclease